MRDVPAPTARLVFRRWREDDLPLARELFGDPEVTALVGGPFDDAAVQARLATEIATELTHHFQYWPMFSPDGAHVGCCGLGRREPAVHELGFYLRPRYWGMGFAVEAGQAVIEHAFDVLGATALFAGHHPENRASRRVLERLGFRHTHDELYPPTGLVHPGYRRER